MAADQEEPLSALYKQARRRCDDLRSLMISVNIAKSIQLAWEDEASRLQLWAKNIGAGQLKASTSLDFRLRDAETVRNQLRKQLRELSTALQEAIDSVELMRETGATLNDKDESNRLKSTSGDQHGSTQGNETDVDDESEEDDPNEDLQYAFEDTKSTINSLFRMTLYIRNPSRRDQLKRRDISAVSGFASFDEAHVEHKFPDAESGLVKRLGQANTVRRANMRYWERHHHKLAVEESTDDAAPTIAPLSESVATAFHPHSQEADGEDARSHFSGTSYMESMLGGENVRRPDIPEDGKNGGPFQCPICYYIVTVSNEREWMKHVFFDLQPYVCTFPDCKTPLSLYENRRDWFNHVAASHLGQDPRQEMQCPLCPESVRTLPLIRRHLARHLEELALFSLPNSLFGENEDGLNENATVLSSDEEAERVLAQEDIAVDQPSIEGIDEQQQSAKPDTPLEKVQALASVYRDQWLPPSNAFLESPPLDQKEREREYRRLTESIMQHVVLKADELDTAGDAQARLARRELVAEAQRLMKNLDAVLKGQPPPSERQNRRHSPSMEEMTANTSNLNASHSYVTDLNVETLRRAEAWDREAFDRQATDGQIEAGIISSEFDQLARETNRTELEQTQGNDIDDTSYVKHRTKRRGCYTCRTRRVKVRRLRHQRVNSCH
jgi:hypothetical protein